MHAEVDGVGGSDWFVECCKNLGLTSAVTAAARQSLCQLAAVFDLYSCAMQVRCRLGEWASGLVGCDG